MNRGLFLKAAREHWPATLSFGAAIFLVETVHAYVMPSIQAQFGAQWAQLKLIQSVVQAMLGTDASGGMGPEMFLSIAWVHPVVLAIVWAHAIVCSTRMPAGEVDRGTMDVLLGLPVSRREVFVAETGAVGSGALCVLTLAWIGNRIGGSIASAPLHAPASRVGIVLLNLLCLYLAVGGFGVFVSALSDRRGKAMAVVFIAVLASFLLNYLAQFWEPAKRVSFLSLMTYYRPFFILRGGSWPAADMAILAGMGSAAWLAAGVVFSKRDLSTV